MCVCPPAFASLLIALVAFCGRGPRHQAIGSKVINRIVSQTRASPSLT